MSAYIVIEVLLLLVKLWLSYLEAFYRLFIPRRPKSISGEVVLVTGGGHGIGRELALRFAEHGAKVVVWDINKETNDSTVDEIKNRGKSAWGYVCDVTKPDSVHQVAQQVRKDVGEVNILVNNAGILNGLDLLRLEEAQIRRCMDVNTMAHYWTIREFLPKMMEDNHGHIVCTASVAGHRGIANVVDYCTSKFAVIGMMEGVTDEMHKLGKTGIHTTTVCPGFVNTGLTWFPRSRFGRILEPDEVAEQVIEGVLRNERQIFLPRDMQVLVILFKLVPHKFTVTLLDFLDLGIDLQVKENKND